MERKMVGKEGVWSRMLFTKGTQHLLQKICPERALTLSLESGEPERLMEPESNQKHTSFVSQEKARLDFCVVFFTVS